jgi:glutaredoxin-like protein NrdH
MQSQHVDGADKGKVFLYTLSTCIWCRKLKTFLNEQGVAYDYLDVDQQTRDDRAKARDEVLEYNPGLSFPTMVVNDGQEVIVGFDPAKVKEVLKL